MRILKKEHSLFSIEVAVASCIFAFPIFFIAIPKVTTSLATFLFLICFIFFIHINFKNKDILLVLIAFFAYPFAITVSQIFRWKFELIDYQQQGRILLLLPLLFYIYNRKIDLSKFAIFIFPIACFAGAASSLYIFNGASQWGPRNTVAHIDPLNFGYLMLFLAFSSLWTGLKWAKNNWHKVLCFGAFGCGIYMSIKSGSRTGWAGIPIVVFWFLWKSNKLKLNAILATIITLAMASAFIYYFSDIVHNRIDVTIKDFKNYIWIGNPAANDSSVGVRLSMIRMAWHSFCEAPWSGYGVGNIFNVINVDTIKLYASNTVIQFSSSGFMHNEFFTQLVKHGVLGGLAFLFMLYVIFNIFKKLRKSDIQSSFSDVFFIYILFAIVASFSTEILVVKPMILFFGFMLACFAGESLWKIHVKEGALDA